MRDEKVCKYTIFQQIVDSPPTWMSQINSYAVLQKMTDLKNACTRSAFCVRNELTYNNGKFDEQFVINLEQLAKFRMPGA